ncbi:MAG: flavin reductase family protein, partial [Anaerolineae bacterium]|nr:flavin reductase family protein [Anaerolineae bacterium]
MTIETQTFKDVMARWTTGITVVTTVVDETWYGVTINSFTSVSLNPPLI